MLARTGSQTTLAGERLWLYANPPRILRVAVCHWLIGLLALRGVTKPDPKVWYMHAVVLQFAAIWRQQFLCRHSRETEYS